MSETDPSGQDPRTGPTVLPTKAHHPKAFKFPKRTFRKKTVVNWSFQSIWFIKWPWLHYVNNDDAVLCITCAQASVQKKLQWSSSLDLAFISKGFTNWKDATVKFAIHEASKCHKEAILTLPSSTQNVAECMSNSLKKEKLERQQCFLKVLSNIRYLARQGRAWISFTS